MIKRNVQVANKRHNIQNDTNYCTENKTEPTCSQQLETKLWSSAKSDTKIYAKSARRVPTYKYKGGREKDTSAIGWVRTPVRPCYYMNYNKAENINARPNNKLKSETQTKSEKIYYII